VFSAWSSLRLRLSLRTPSSIASSSRFSSLPFGAESHTCCFLSRPCTKRFRIRRPSLRKRPSSLPLQSGSQLYASLLGPVLGKDDKPKLIIVPDGKLLLLPFDSLPDAKGQYLLASHSVSYAPSATVLCLIRTARPTHQPTLPFLGIGDVQYTQQLPVSATNDRRDSPSASAGSRTRRSAAEAPLKACQKSCLCVPVGTDFSTPELFTAVTVRGLNLYASGISYRLVMDYCGCGRAAACPSNL
jgi:hypothetical protein